MDNDGKTEIAVSAELDNQDEASSNGALWILSLNSNGTVKWNQRVSKTTGNFNYPISNYKSFGSSCTALGDVDKDGINDIAVGMKSSDSDVGGAVFILFMNNDGTVKSTQKIGSNSGNFNESLEAGDNFGKAITSLGDLNGDNVTDIAVTIDSDENQKGDVYVLFLNSDGTVKSYKRMGQNYSSTPPKHYFFGCTIEDISQVSDINGDGVQDMIMGAFNSNDGGNGMLWVNFLNSDGTINGYQQISSTKGNFMGELSENDYFGSSVSSISENATNVQIAVGAYGDDDGGIDRGAIWLLSLKKQNMLSKSLANNNPKTETKSELTESSVLSIENENVNFYVYPNPYRENTTINYELKEGSKMNIEVYSITGQKIYEIFNGQQKAGNYRYDFNAKRLGFPAGTYILKIDINEKVNTFKLIELE